MLSNKILSIELNLDWTHNISLIYSESCSFSRVKYELKESRIINKEKVITISNRNLLVHIKDATRGEKGVCKVEAMHRGGEHRIMLDLFHLLLTMPSTLGAVTPGHLWICQQICSILQPGTCSSPLTTQAWDIATAVPYSLESISDTYRERLSD